MTPNEMIEKGEFLNNGKPLTKAEKEAILSGSHPNDLLGKSISESAPEYDVLGGWSRFEVGDNWVEIHKDGTVILGHIGHEEPSVKLPRRIRSSEARRLLSKDIASLHRKGIISDVMYENMMEYYFYRYLPVSSIFKLGA